MTLSRFLITTAVFAAPFFNTHAFLASKNNSPLPLTASGGISNPRAFETSTRLIVAGSVTSPHRSAAAHVDIQLVAADGRLITAETDAIAWPHPRTAASRHGRATFTGGFPLTAARQAARIVVSFRNGSHANCPTIRG